MRLLLDTRVWLWMVLAPERMNVPTREALGNAANDRVLSVASAWELGIKHALGKVQMTRAPEALVRDSVRDFRLSVLPITLEDALGAAALPPIHKDPFDRILVAQAEQNGLILVTADASVRAYGVAILWAM